MDVVLVIAGIFVTGVLISIQQNTKKMEIYTRGLLEKARRVEKIIKIIRDTEFED